MSLVRCERDESCGVTILTLNNPKKCNAWSQGMMRELFAQLSAAADDAECVAVVLTGSDEP
eukprot:gene16090-13752_t